MKKRFVVAGAALLALIFSVVIAVQPAHAAAGFTVNNGRLYDANGNEFIMRGVSHAHVWYPTQTSSFANIKALGANTVRVVLSGGRWPANSADDVRNVISLCKANRLICVLENHDTTGFGEQAGAVTLDAAVDYWIGLQSVLTGQENYVIINIGNEPIGNNPVTPGWTEATSSAVRRLRAAGFDHTIMVDAPNWGQDWQFTMRDNAQTVFNADPDRNLVFSIHMYGVFDTAAEVNAYLNSFRTRGLPIVVGEFGNNHSDGNPDEDTIMASSQSLGIGYIGWSWSGNGGGVEYLDMVTNFNPASLTPWGERFFNGPNGIRATSRESSVYGGGGGSSSSSGSSSAPVDRTAPSTPGTPTASGVTASGVSLSWAASTDNVGVTGYTVVRVQGTTETTVASPTGTSAAITGLAANTAYTFAVYARDAAGNRSTRSATVNVTTTGGGGGGSGCRVAYRVTNNWPGGFQGDVTITNTAAAAVNGWTLQWTFANGQRVNNMWGGVATSTGTAVSVTNADYTRTIAPNGSVNLGFIGSSTGTNTNPAAFTLNGTACTVA